MFFQKRHKACRHLPILVGLLGAMDRQVSWLMGNAHCAFPYICTVAYCSLLPFTVAGPRWIFTNFPIKSCYKRHPFISLCNFPLQLIIHELLNVAANISFFLLIVQASSIPSTFYRKQVCRQDCCGLLLYIHHAYHPCWQNLR